MNKRRALWTAVFLATVVVLCIAGTKISRLTRTTTFQEDSLFLVVTGVTANGTLETRAIEASNMVARFNEFPGSGSNFVSAIKTNGVTASSPARSINFIAVSNVTINVSNSAGLVDVRLSASGSGGGGSAISTNGNQFGASTDITIKDGARLTNAVVAGIQTNVGTYFRLRGDSDPTLEITSVIIPQTFYANSRGMGTRSGGGQAYFTISPEEVATIEVASDSIKPANGAYVSIGTVGRPFTYSYFDHWVSASNIFLGPAVKFLQGNASPEGVYAAQPQSIYFQTNQTSGIGLWLKTNGTGSSGWWLLSGAGGGGGLSDGNKGDITVSGSSSAWTNNANSITYSKMQDISATQRVIGRNTAGSGDPEEVTLSQLLDWVGTTSQGDILYKGASSWSRLAAGTSGQLLQTPGPGGNPLWATVGTLTDNDKGDITVSGSGTVFSVDPGAITSGKIASGILITNAGINNLTNIGAHRLNGQSIPNIDKTGEAISIGPGSGPNYSIATNRTVTFTYSGSAQQGQQISLTVSNTSTTNFLVGFPTAFAPQVGSNVTSWTVVSSNYLTLPFRYSTNEIGGGMWSLGSVVGAEIEFFPGSNITFTTNGLGVTIASTGGGSGVAVTSLSTTNATSKPLTNSNNGVTAAFFGLQAGFNGEVTMNASNIVVGSSTNLTLSSVTIGTTNVASALAGKQPIDRISVLLYGADPTGASDSTPAFNLAATAAARTNVLYVPSGNYLLSNFVFNGLLIEGDGPTSILSVRATNTSTAMFCTNVGTWVRNLSFNGGTNGAFDVGSPPCNTTGLVHSAKGLGRVENCVFTKFQTALYIFGDSDVTLREKQAIYTHNNFTNNFVQIWCGDNNHAEYVLIEGNQLRRSFYGLINRTAGNIYFKGNLIVDTADAAISHDVSAGGKGNSAYTGNTINHCDTIKFNEGRGLFEGNNCQVLGQIRMGDFGGGTGIQDMMIRNNTFGGVTIMLFTGTCLNNMFLGNTFTSGGAPARTGFTSQDQCRFINNTDNYGPIWESSFSDLTTTYLTVSNKVVSPPVAKTNAAIVNAGNGYNQYANLGSDTNLTFVYLSGSDSSNSVPINVSFTQDIAGSHFVTLNGVTVGVDTNALSITDVLFWFQNGRTNCSWGIPSKTGTLVKGDTQIYDGTNFINFGSTLSNGQVLTKTNTGVGWYGSSPSGGSGVAITSLSITNATSKPLTNSNNGVTAAFFGLQAGFNGEVTMNASNIVVGASTNQTLASALITTATNGTLLATTSADVASLTNRGASGFAGAVTHTGTMRGIGAYTNLGGITAQSSGFQTTDNSDYINMVATATAIDSTFDPLLMTWRGNAILSLSTNTSTLSSNLTVNGNIIVKKTSALLGAVTNTSGISSAANLATYDGSEYFTFGALGVGLDTSLDNWGISWRGNSVATWSTNTTVIKSNLTVNGSVNIKTTNFVGTLALPNVATNKPVMLGGGSNVVEMPLAPGITGYSWDSIMAGVSTANRGIDAASGRWLLDEEFWLQTDAAGQIGREYWSRSVGATTVVTNMGSVSTMYGEIACNPRTIGARYQIYLGAITSPLFGHIRMTNAEVLFMTRLEVSSLDGTTGTGETNTVRVGMQNSSAIATSVEPLAGIYWRCTNNVWNLITASASTYTTTASLSNVVAGAPQVLAWFLDSTGTNVYGFVGSTSTNMACVATNNLNIPHSGTNVVLPVFTSYTSATNSTAGQTNFLDYIKVWARYR